MEKKKRFAKFVAILLAVLVIGFIASAITGCHSTTREYGGEMTIELEPNQKLELITWKGEENSLWILTRPMREDEHAETHTYYEDSEWGVFEGKVTIIEKEE